MNWGQIQSRIRDGSYQFIRTDKITAKKITAAFLNKGWWFICFHQEENWFIGTSDSLDFQWYRKRGYKFELEA